MTVGHDRGSARDVVGRERDVAAVIGLLNDGERIVTLVGSGGVGKTALARAIVAASVDGSDPWIARVPCAGIASAAALADAIGAALGLSLAPANAALVDVGRALAARGPGVLVLDGLEEGATLAPALVRCLEIAPELSLLITTRAPLGIASERTFEVRELALPAAGEDALVSPAVRCFVLAAGRVRPSYAPQPSELPFVVEIVTLLDGHPLALELAAARLAVMGERALLHRLRQSLAVARGADQTSALGTAAVATALAGSWAALSARERTVLGACAVFRGGFTVLAAEAVVPGGETIDVLQSLRRQSLVRARSSADGEIRLSLSALVRVFAAARLADAGEATMVEARHAAFYASGPPTPSTPRARHAFALAERENLLAVVERVIALPIVDARVAEPALRALCLLGPLARSGGPTAAAFALLAPALRATQGSGADPRLRAEVLALRAEAHRRAGQLPGAARDLLEAAAIARAVDDAALIAQVDNQLAFLGASRGELSLAREHHERAARAFARLGRRDGEGDALRGLGAVLARQGDRRAARVALERAVASHRHAGDEAALAEDHLTLGAVLLDEGDSSARTVFAEGGKHAAEAGDRVLVAWAGGWIGQVDHDAGDRDAAEAAYVRASLDLEALGQPLASAVFVGLSGLVARQRDRAGEAYAQMSAALDVLGEAGERAFALLLRGHLAVLQVLAERPAEAEVLWAQITRATEPETEPSLRAALSVLGAQAGFAPPSDGTAQTSSFHARIALRCAAHAAADPRSATPLPLPPEALLLGPGATWFRPPHGGRVSLERRRPMALLLDALVTARVATPGRAVSSDELLAAAWPGEKVIASAGAHRVRVAVASLRKLGLRELVQTIEPGYRLASDVLAIRVGR